MALEEQTPRQASIAADAILALLDSDPDQGLAMLRVSSTLTEAIVRSYLEDELPDSFRIFNPMSPRSTAPNFTPKQGQYLAFIYAYTHVLGRPPAEVDLRRHFGVSPPSVHQMVLTLERAELILRFHNHSNIGVEV